MKTDFSPWAIALLIGAVIALAMFAYNKFVDADLAADARSASPPAKERVLLDKAVTIAANGSHDVWFDLDKPATVSVCAQSDSELYLAVNKDGKRVEALCVSDAKKLIERQFTLEQGKYMLVFSSGNWVDDAPTRIKITAK